MLKGTDFWGERRLLIALLFSVSLVVAGCASANNELQNQMTRNTANSTTMRASAPKPVTTTTTLQLAEFSTERTLQYTQDITAFGPRVEGGKAEKAAIDYAAGMLEGMGYAVERQEFLLPNKKTSQNLIIEIPGNRNPDQIFIIGGHIDSLWKTPGANDNALGVALVLELAQYFKEHEPPVTLRLIVFGAEEYGNKKLDQHHFGSRYYVQQLSAEEIDRINGMVSIDVVGFGESFRARALGKGSTWTCDHLIKNAQKLGVKMIYETAPEWSDHEPFEKAGIPSAWLFCSKDPTYHTAQDVVGHLNPENIEFVGNLLIAAILDMNSEPSNQ